MTVTIKKNVDVQATLEAKQLKYQIKRDLSGDVQWTNMTQVGNLTISYCCFSGAGSRSIIGTTTKGFNFVKLPKVTYSVTGFTPVIFIKINGVTKTSTSFGNGVVTVSGTWTPTTRSITTTAAGPNNITLVISWQDLLDFSANFASSMQRNDKVTVMK